MKKPIRMVLYSLFLSFALINVAYATSGSFEDQFLASPLLPFVAIIIIDIIAFIYRKIRK